MKKYIGQFSDRKSIESAFECTLPTGIDILAAWYASENWEGSAFVLYRHEGKLFEVNGSHCSCNGLEGQWQPEETSVRALEMRKWGDGYFSSSAEMAKLMDSVITGLKMEVH